MIKFNELRMTPDHKFLIIDASVLHIKNYFDNVTISRITVVSDKEYSDTIDSNNPIFDTETYTNENGEFVYKDLLAQKTTKDIRIELSESDLQKVDSEGNIITVDMVKNMFIVYVYTNGNTDQCIPCVLQQKFDIGATFSDCLFYNNMLSHLNDLNARCSSPTGLINSFLEYKAIKIAIETGNIKKGIELYRAFLNHTTLINSNTSCNCQ